MAGENGKTEVTVDQAADALRELMAQRGDEPAAAPAAEPEPAPAAEPAPTAAAAAEPQPAEEQEPAAEPVAGDDLESLRRRLSEIETERTRDRQVAKAAEQRRMANEQILRDRFLRKSTAADRALKALKASRTEGGIDEAEVARVIQEIEATMNPASPSYAPPRESAAATEDQALVVNDFLNEKGLTAEEGEAFGRWVAQDSSKVMSPTEQAVANESLGGFLRLAHARWQEQSVKQDQDKRRSDTVGAVRSIQRNQREAARAASGAPAGPKRVPAAKPTEVDVSKLTKDDVSRLVRESVEYYR